MPTSSAEVMDSLSCTSSDPYFFHVWCLNAVTILPSLTNVFAIFTKHYACVCCAIIDVATSQMLLIFKIKVQVEKCGNL